jgi:hypothetical protein
VGLFMVSAPINAARPNRQRPFSGGSCRWRRAITHERAEIAFRRRNTSVPSNHAASDPRHEGVPDGRW